MAFLADNVLDNGVQYVVTNGSRVDINDAEPATYTAATSTNSLGNATGLTVSGPTDGDTSGRKAVVPAISNGSVTADGTATHWSLTDGTAELIAAQTLSSSQAVTNGNTFTLSEIDITIPDPA